MSYTINLTDGAIFAVIPDGTINTSSSMTLVGKNYAGYGQFLDTNFVHLLENSSNTTPPGAPLTGQLWWDSGNNLLQVYNGSQWKTISSATSSATAPTGNVEGDLWYDSTNQQLKVWTGTTWLLIGPNYSQGTGVTGAFANVIVDTGAVTHKVIQLVVNSAVVGIVSEDAVFTPQTTIPGFANVNPGLQLASTVNGQTPQFWGNSSGTNQLNGLSSTSFMRTDANTTTTGTLAVNNNTGLTVGASQDFRVSVASTNATIANQTAGGNIAFVVNVPGTGPTTALTIFGANGTIRGTQITAQYADVAERFEADAVLAPGTVVELGGSAEITQSTTDLSDKVFGVISTRAAYLMNSSAGSDATHPAVAMTGRVPVRTIGTVYKGDRLVSAGNGLARAAQAGEATAFNVIGRALQDKLDTGEGTVEAIVTIK
jgi:hypothetical protein